MNDNELREAGLKVTIPRIKILRILEAGNPSHLSAEDVYRRLLDQGEDVGLATVYRVLTQFEAAGLVRRHNFESGHSVFELNQGEHHDHLVCIRCDTVVEFMDEDIERRQTAVAKNAGFHMTDHSQIVYGVCKTCQVKGEQ